MMVNSRGHDIYVFLMDGFNETREALTDWSPESEGLGELPRPQLLYNYNGWKPASRQTTDEVRDLRQQVQWLTAIGESKFDNMASKMSSLTTSLEDKIDSKLGEAGKVIMESMQNLMTTQQRES
jgi:hypothetical protein